MRSRMREEGVCGVSGDGKRWKKTDCEDEKGVLYVERVCGGF